MRRFLVLLAMLLGVSMPVLANFVANDALPAIEQSVGRGSLDSRWITNAYLISFATLLLAGGALGDRFGRKGILMWGIVIFTAASAACGLAQTPEQLIGARAVQGLGAALLVPATLSILATGDKGRGAGLGLWAAVSTVAVVYGPLTGAYILRHYSWNWLFLVNVPAGVVVLILGTAVQNSRYPSLFRRLDLPGMFLGTLALGLLSYGLAEGNFRGWRHELVAGSLLLGAFFLVIFLFVESRRAQPMVSLRFAGHATFSASNAVAAAVFFAVFGMSIFLPAYLRNFLGYTPDTTAIRLLPFAGALLMISPIVGKISDRLGSRGLMTYGCVIAAAGLGLLLQADLEPAYETVIVPALVLMGCGMALTVGPMTTAVTGVVDRDEVGGASGVTNTARQLGLLVGVALLGTVATSAFKNSFIAGLVSAGVESSAAASIAESAPALSVLSGGSFEPLRAQMPPGTAPGVLDGVVRAAQDSFIDALHTGVLLSIGFMLLAAMISLIFVRSHATSLAGVEAEPAASEREGGAVMEDSPEEPVAPEHTDPTPTPHIPVGSPTGRAGEDPQADVQAAPSEGEADRQPEAEPAGDLVESAVVLKPSRPLRPAENPVDYTTVLFQLPFKAGTSTLVQNVKDFLRSTLRFYDEPGSVAPPPVPLPEPIAGGLNATTSADIASLTGYLLLEQRFGRIKAQTRPELAATALIGAARSMKQWSFDDDTEEGADDFLPDLIKVVMEGIGPVSAALVDGVTTKETPMSA